MSFSSNFQNQFDREFNTINENLGFASDAKSTQEFDSNEKLQFLENKFESMIKRLREEREKQHMYVQKIQKDPEIQEEIKDLEERKIVTNALKKDPLQQYQDDFPGLDEFEDFADVYYEPVPEPVPEPEPEPVPEPEPLRDYEKELNTRRTQLDNLSAVLALDKELLAKKMTAVELTKQSLDEAQFKLQDALKELEAQKKKQMTVSQSDFVINDKDTSNSGFTYDVGLKTGNCTFDLCKVAFVQNKRSMYTSFIVTDGTHPSYYGDENIHVVRTDLLSGFLDDLNNNRNATLFLHDNFVVNVDTEHNVIINDNYKFDNTDGFVTRVASMVQLLLTKMRVIANQVALKELNTYIDCKYVMKGYVPNLNKKFAEFSILEDSDETFKLALSEFKQQYGSL